MVCAALLHNAGSAGEQETGSQADYQQKYDKSAYDLEGPCSIQKGWFITPVALHDVVLNSKIGAELQPYDKNICNRHNAKHLRNQEASHDQIAQQSDNLRCEMSADYPSARLENSFT